jgi:translation initiation factor IF-3
VRVIGEDGEQLGVMPPLQALLQAQEKGYDLVEISPNADPPVVKIMDYGRFLYEQNKKQHEARKHQKGHKLKEVKFRPRTDQHDWDFKKKHVIRFLEDGDKVKVIVMFRGREMAHKDIGHAKLKKLVEEVAEYGDPEKRPSLEGRWLSTIIAPKVKPKGGGKAKAKKTPEAGEAETGKTKAPKAEPKAKAAPKAKKAKAKPAAKKAKPAADA